MLTLPVSVLSLTSKMSSIQYLQELTTNYIIGIAKPTKKDDMNNLYVYWVADEDKNLEGQDVYAAWQPDSNHDVYLPMVLK